MRGHLRKLLALLNRRDKQWLLVILAAMVLSSLLEVFSIGSVPLLITLVADPARLESLPLVGRLADVLEGQPRKELVILGGVLFLAVFMVRTAVMVITRYMQFRFAATRQVRFSTELFKRYLLAPYFYHLQHNSSELIRNVQVGAMRIGGQVIAQVLAGIQHLLLLVAILILLFVADPVVTVVSLGIFGLFGALFLRFTSARARALGQIEMQQLKATLQLLRQSLEGIREIQLLGRPAYFVQEFKRSMRAVAIAQRDKQMIAFLSGPLLEMLAIVTLVVLMFSLLAMGRSLSSAVAMLGLYAVSFVRLKSSLALVLGVHTNLNYALVSVDPVFDGLTALPGERPNVVESKRLGLSRSIALRDVSFSYPGAQQRVLAGISLQIPKGSYLGISGTTGAGKSTLVNVLLGILPPDEGQVLVDGVDIQTTLSDWQNTIGYVPQDLFLLDDSVRRNVALGMPDEAINEQAVRAALRRAQLIEFVDSLPLGLDTPIGERGVRLSGGQKQRISIARALYREPQVLVLDEATSALDGPTESEFLAAVRALREGLTIISVAHRETTLADCDLRVRLDSGRLTLSRDHRLADTGP